MTTTCQLIVDGARKFNTLNPALTTDVAEMLARILADQQEVFPSVAGLTRERFQTVAGVASTAGVSGRVINLAAPRGGTGSLGISREMTSQSPALLRDGHATALTTPRGCSARSRCARPR
jgi:hypothetical protein